MVDGDARPQKMRLYAQVGQRLQIVIAAADPLAALLEPLRAVRVKRQTKVAAGVGGAASAVVGGALIAANLGLWASVGVAFGVAALPVVLVLGRRGVALGRSGTSTEGGTTDERERRVAVAYACLAEMADADGRVSDEEKLLLSAVLHEVPLSGQQRAAIESADREALLARASELAPLEREQLLEGAWMLAEADGSTPEEDRQLDRLAQRMGYTGDLLAIKRRTRDRQSELNELVTAMFRACQHTLQPSLGDGRANAFLESLALLAATPQARRSLRNSLSSGFSAGGVIQALNAHAQPHKLAAQAHNAARAVYGGDLEQRKHADQRLFELCDNSRLGKRAAVEVCADIDVLFEQLLRSEGEGAEDA